MTTYHDVHRPAGATDHRSPITDHRRKAPRSYPEAGTAPLSRAQMAKICILAKDAFTNEHGRAPADEAELTEWRRAEQFRGIGKPSLTVCLQGDYLPLIKHFSELAGEVREAYDAGTKDATQNRRLAMHKLKEACAEAGLQLSYPAAICRQQNKCALEDATAKQLWRLVFTIRNRTAKKKVAAAAADTASEEDPF